MIVAHRSLTYFASTALCTSKRQRINFGAQLMIWRLRHDPATVGVLTEERDTRSRPSGRPASVGMKASEDTYFRPPSTAFQVWFGRKGEVTCKKPTAPSSPNHDHDHNHDRDDGDRSDDGEGIPDLLAWEKHVLALGGGCSRVAFQLSIFGHQVLLNTTVSKSYVLARGLACGC
jgi:hypothetical protein